MDTPASRLGKQLHENSGAYGSAVFLLRKSLEDYRLDKRVWAAIYICFRFRRGTPRLDWSYYPIDASTAHIIRGFLSFYEAGFGELYLAKAKALADQITVM